MEEIKPTNVKPTEFYMKLDNEEWKYLKEEDEAFEYDFPENKHNNTIKSNKEYLIKSKKILKQIIDYELWDEIDRDRAIEDYTNWIRILEEALNDGYLITIQVKFLLKCVNDELEELILRKESKSRFEFEKLNFDCLDEKVFSLIRREVKWKKKDRDFTIYKERKKGRLLEDIGKEYGLDDSSISKIEKKVDGAFKYYKGKLFEKFYYNVLVKRYPDCEVEWYGKKSEPDIIVTDPTRNIKTIYSLKNLKINRENYRLKKDELKPELKAALLSLLEYEEAFLKLVVFDNISNKIIEKDIDFKKPSDIILK